MPLAGTMDVQAFAAENVRTVRSYVVLGPRDALPRLVARVLTNEAVEQAVLGPITLDHLGQGHSYRFRLVTVPLGAVTVAVALGRQGTLLFVAGNWLAFAGLLLVNLGPLAIPAFVYPLISLVLWLRRDASVSRAICCAALI